MYDELRIYHNIPLIVIRFELDLHLDLRWEWLEIVVKLA